MILKAREIASAVGGMVISGDPETVIKNITTDSRKIKGSDLFIPIIGERADGHSFVAKTLEAGAAASFTAYDMDKLNELNKGAVLIRVEDTKKALQDLGAYYRENYVKIPYIGVTGSVGKTTVREMIAAALSAGFKVYSTKGNANSQTGVPITVTETDPDAEIGVIEMGISEFGEMSRISRVVKCDMAVFTVIGVSHIGNLGSQDNIMREKLKICEGMKKDGVLLLNGDDELLSREDLYDFIPAAAVENGLKVYYYGTGEKSFVRAADIKENNGYAEYDLYIDGQKITHAELTVPGMHMLLNSLAAIAAAYFNGVDPEAAVKALKAFSSLDGRGRITEKNGITVINDAYNAAPQSMMAGLKVLDGLKNSGRKIAVLADMLELGPDEASYHREVGTYIATATKSISTVLLYGKLSSHIAEGIQAALDKHDGKEITVLHFDSLEALKQKIAEDVKPGDAILFKGSNSMKLGGLVTELFGD
ncbi:MAG: UDP-N-acetylmuramoyl-tripeptide--D-alanyl-D-alanine ligase [Eubacteriales bacterium]|nr:UDP-N-acetylmuramoyl-tripeptide--D-alanyl-D-alanine ligase [Eubacteriales bacterium]